MKLSNFGRYVSTIRVIFLLFVLFLLGCSKSDNQVINDNWENEILMMEDCGSDGLKCCVDQEPACLFGQTCCVDPNNLSRNYCASECVYGNLDEYCLEGDTCNDTLVCMNGNCVECGVEGNYCCTSDKKCLTDDFENNNRTECVENICKPCGHLGNKICSGELDCVSGHFNNNGVCLNCGGFNQPCCKVDGGNGCLEDDLICELGFCVK